MKRLLVSISLLIGAGILAGCTASTDINGNADLQTNLDANNTTIGTMTDAQGRVMYRGEIENDMQNGSGTSYDASGNVIYVGMRNDGEAEGEGKLYYAVNGKVAYEGNREDGQPEGEGTRFYTNGQIAFEGTFDNGNPAKQGILYDTEGNVIFQGSFGGAVDMSKQVIASGSNTGEYRMEKTDGFIDDAGKLHTSLLFHADAEAKGQEAADSAVSDTDASVNGAASATSSTTQMIHIGGDHNDDRIINLDSDTQSDIDADANADTSSTIDSADDTADVGAAGNGSAGAEGTTTTRLNVKGLLE